MWVRAGQGGFFFFLIGHLADVSIVGPKKTKKTKKNALTCTIATSIPLESNLSVSRNCERPGTSDSGSTGGTGPPPEGARLAMRRRRRGEESSSA